MTILYIENSLFFSQREFFARLIEDLNVKAILARGVGKKKTRGLCSAKGTGTVHPTL
jgi:hypothetical protein